VSAKYRAAEVHAERVLNDLEKMVAPIDPFAIAEQRDILVEVEVCDGPGVSGALMKVGDSFAIACFDRYGSPGYLRFTLAHELGHYFLPEHPLKLFPSGSGEHQSRAGFTSTEPHEREADHFAAALLMPRALVCKTLNGVDPGLAAVRRLHEVYDTSLTASAIRYAKLSADPVAVVVSSGGKVDYCFCSESLRETDGDMWLRKGEVVPPGTVTAGLGSRQEADGDVSLDLWFDGVPPASVYEEVFHLGQYGRTLTVISSTDSIEAEEEMEDRMKKYFT